MMITAIISVFLIISCSTGNGGVGASASTSSSALPSTSTPSTPVFGGLPKDALDQIHSYVAESIAHSLESSPSGDLHLPIGTGVLTIKSPIVTEVKFADFQYDFIEPNRIHSALTKGRVVADGMWQFHSGGSDQSISSGKYRSTIIDGELELTGQLDEIGQAKQKMHMIDCKTNFSQFEVAIEGGDKLTSLQDCRGPVCEGILKRRTDRSFYDNVICQILRKVYEGIFNTRLAIRP